LLVHVALETNKMVRKSVLALISLTLVICFTMREEFSVLSRLFAFDLITKEDVTNVWTTEDEPLEFDADGEEETQDWINKESELSSIKTVEEPVTTEVLTILPSKNSNRTLASLYGKCTNATLERRQKINYGIHIIMTFYKGSYRKDRFRELLVALRKNLRNPYVTAVHTLWEDRDPILYVNSTELEKKLVRVQFGVQPTYKDLFDYANLRLGRGAVGIVLNSDIYIDESLGCIQPTSPKKKSFNATKQHLVYALSRHPSNPCAGRSDYCEDYTGSHDAFIFALPLPPNFSRRLDFTQNNIAAENVVIWEFKRLEGYLVKNPCHTVKIYHLHCTNERHYSKGAISRGKNRIGPIDRHASVVPTFRLKCGQVIY
jgi:hypothetical protein